MSESHVTQCPHCRTSFRVSQAQLAAAHGAVRCGACLHVFNA
ncbi:zinc-ribbon domain-containing protein, partial [Pseudomonas sp. GD04158]